MDKMSTDDIKSIKVPEISSKKPDWEFWESKFLARAGQRLFKELLLHDKDAKKVPTRTEFLTISAKAGNTRNDDEKEKHKYYQKNSLVYEELILCINSDTAQGKVAAQLVINAKNEDWPDGNVTITWKSLVRKYAPRSTPSLCKLHRLFTNSKLESVTKDPDQWITYLESIRTKINQINLSKDKMSKQTLMIHILNNVPEEYDVVLDRMEDKLCLKDDNDNKLTVEDIHNKLSDRYKKLKNKHYENTKKKALVAYQSSRKGMRNYADCLETSDNNEKDNLKNNFKGKPLLKNGDMTKFGYNEKGTLIW